MRLLTDPVPQLVSLVEHGANQTPFLAVKSLKGADEMSKRGTVAKSGAAQETRADLHKMVFSGAAYATETAVRSYLDAQAYKGAKIEAEGDTFVVKGLDADRFAPGTMREIQAGKGLVMHAGQLKADAEPAATTVDKGASAPDAPDASAPDATVSVLRTLRGAPELTQKWSSWMAEYSDASTLAAALEAGKDGLPPGMYEISSAFNSALRNVLGSEEAAGKPEKVKAICAEFAEYINALQALLEDTTVTSRVSKAALLTAFKREPAPEPVAKTENINIRLTFNGDTATVANDERPSAPTTAAILPAATGSVNGPGEVNGAMTQDATVGGGIPITGAASDGPKELAAKAGEGTPAATDPAKPADSADPAAAPAAEGAAKAPEGAAPVQPVSPGAAPAAPAATDFVAAMKAMADGITNLTAALGTQAADQKAALDAVKETVEKTVARVDAAESRSTSRKSAAEASPEGGTQEKTEKSAVEVRHSTVMRSNLLGGRRRR